MFASGAIGRLREGVVIMILLAVIPWIAGCGGAQTLEGTVTLDDRPLAQGYINFRPTADAEGPPVGGPIAQGKYSIASKASLEGPFRVEITAVGKTGKMGLTEMGTRVELEGQVLPARYNTQSTLQVKIERKKRSEFPFAVKSK